MVAAEVTGFASTGGLGDVLAALPPALAATGEQVAVLLPLYRQVHLTHFDVAAGRLPVRLGSQSYSARILEHIRDSVRWLFVDIPELYDRAAIYDEHGREYPDNHLRFGALCEAALSVARYLVRPDILHSHDWHAALVPVFLKQRYWLHPAYAGIKTVLTIHNLGYQGRLPPDALDDWGLSQSASFLEAGIVSSDTVTTVSPTYAREIQTPALGFGLDAVLRSKPDGVMGILNGADDSWNPASDPHITQHFDRHDLSGKQLCKRALLAEANLPETLFSKPLVGVVSRLVEQKGFELLMRIPREFAAEDLSLIALGSGDQRFEDFFRWFAAAYPKRVAVRIAYDGDLARRIIAGSDLFLMPSRYEPCGLNQMYAMRYGTLPVVHATGGLEDTVDADTGFKFGKDDPQALLDSLRTARRTYGTPRWSEMMETAMQRDFSWAGAASQYIRLYRAQLAHYR